MYMSAHIILSKFIKRVEEKRKNARLAEASHFISFSRLVEHLISFSQRV